MGITLLKDKKAKGCQGKRREREGERERECHRACHAQELAPRRLGCQRTELSYKNKGHVL